MGVGGLGKRGRTGEALLTGRASSQPESRPRGQRRGAGCARSPMGVRRELLPADFSLGQPQTEPPRGPRRKIAGPPATVHPQTPQRWGN